MSQDKEKTSFNDESSQQEKFFVPDYSELWKEWYFRIIFHNWPYNYIAPTLNRPICTKNALGYPEHLVKSLYFIIC
jgi:hypothetical protein